MIFVTVGTTGFDELIKFIDQFCINYNEEFITQIGPGAYVPQNCKYFRYAPSLQEYFQDASIIISHGGLATATEVIKLNKPLIAIEDRTQPDRHQREILQVWSDAKHLFWCPDMNDLLNYIEKAQNEAIIPYEESTCNIHNVITQYIDEHFGNG